MASIFPYGPSFVTDRSAASLRIQSNPANKGEFSSVSPERFGLPPRRQPLQTNPNRISTYDLFVTGHSRISFSVASYFTSSAPTSSIRNRCFFLSFLSFHAGMDWMFSRSVSEKIMLHRGMRNDLTRLPRHSLKRACVCRGFAEKIYSVGKEIFILTIL